MCMLRTMMNIVGHEIYWYRSVCYRAVIIAHSIIGQSLIAHSVIGQSIIAHSVIGHSVMRVHYSSFLFPVVAQSVIAESTHGYSRVESVISESYFIQYSCFISQIYCYSSLLFTPVSCYSRFCYTSFHYTCPIFSFSQFMGDSIIAHSCFLL